jgi:hypothetical protein
MRRFDLMHQVKPLPARKPASPICSRRPTPTSSISLRPWSWRKTGSRATPLTPCPNTA